ncbi:hypothetical protein [Cupriavidus necator]
MTRCKVGDLAYLSSDCVDEGVIVEVLRPIKVDGSDLPAWTVRARTPVQCEMSVSKVLKRANDFQIEDRYLRPISGVPVHDEQQDEVPHGLG